MSASGRHKSRSSPNCFTKSLLITSTVKLISSDSRSQATVCLLSVILTLIEVASLPVVGFVVETTRTSGQHVEAASQLEVSSREPFIQYHREISPQHFSFGANGSSLTTGLVFEVHKRQLESGDGRQANSTPVAPTTTTTTMTTNAMSPLDAAPTFDVQPTSTTTTSPAFVGTTSSRNRTLSSASEQLASSDQSTNTIVVTNLAPQNEQVATSKPKSGAKLARNRFRCNNSQECNNGALCHNGVCFCSPGFTGDTCETDIDECRQFGGNGGGGNASQPACLNGGQCVDEINAFRCQCAPGFQGERCQETVDLCADSPCLNGALCSNHRVSYTCHCAPGWAGARCEQNLDDCLQAPCSNGGLCRDLVADFECNCAPGWAGKRCELNIDDCALNPCQNSSTVACVDLLNDYQCECAPGFAGKNCQIDIDECRATQCLNNAKCVDLINGFRCLCAEGWTGPRCELDVNECEQIKPPVCLNGGVCENLEPSYRCHCRDGWTGPNCLDIADYCKAKRPCGRFGVCKSLQNSSASGAPFQCECQSAYVGARCEHKRTCLNECNSEHGHCVANTTTCACQPRTNSTIIRQQCQLLKSCDQFEFGQLCLNGGQCRNLPEESGYECDCAPGFNGPICQYVEEKSAPDLLLVVAICGLSCLLVACAIVSLLVFRRVRKARATRGTYSPSTQEKFETNSAIGDLLKVPSPERLI